MDWGDDLPARSVYRAKLLLERALDKAVLLDSERSSQITDTLIMLLTEIEQLLNGDEPFDGEEPPEQLELDFGDPGDHN